MAKKRDKKSRSKWELATAILLAVAAALNIVDKILEWLLR